MHRSISTLFDELNRNKVNDDYDPKKAHHKAYKRRKNSKYQGMNIVSESKLRDFVEENLLDGQSPENISGRLKSIEKELPSVSKNSIYRFIGSPYGRRIEARMEKGRRKSRRGKKTEKLSDRKFIEERPEYINLRENIGDTEGDFIVSGKSGEGILLVVADRKVRAAFI